jgi:hypothetical protein
MAQYLVLAITALPSQGASTAGQIYLGDHVSEEAAVIAAAPVLNLVSGALVWVVSAPSISKYQVTLGAKNYSAAAI